MPPALPQPIGFDLFRPATHAQVPSPRWNEGDTTQMPAVRIPAWQDRRSLTSEVFACALAWHGDRRLDAETISLYKANQIVGAVLARYSVPEILGWCHAVPRGEQQLRWDWAAAVMTRAYPAMCTRRPLPATPPFGAAARHAYCA